MPILVLIIFLTLMSCNHVGQDMVDCKFDSTNFHNIKIDKWKYVVDYNEYIRQDHSTLRSLLRANEDKNMFLFSTRAENNQYVLNGDTLEHKRFKQQNFYPVHLRKGMNELIALTDTVKSEHHISLELCDSASCMRLMAESMFGRMFYPLIDPDSVTFVLDMKYYRVLPVSSKMEIFDVYGDKIHEFKISDNNLNYIIPHLHNGHSYKCRWTFGEFTTTQTFVCGKPDMILNQFKELACIRHLNANDSLEIDQLLRRFQFLMDHPSREDDWWWQFKIAPISYQLESIFSKMNGKSIAEPTLKFESYNSPIDGKVQRCVVFTPKDLSKKYPLVVMIRPDEANSHDFFSCPQLARQWAVNNAQMLCEKYGFITVIPEGRLPQSGILSDVMENEILAAVNVMKTRFPIDEKNIFLHANCSGGMRALQLASHHPQKFKAMGLYAPFFVQDINDNYPKEIKVNLESLKKMPIFVQGDPLDDHSPPIYYKDLLIGMNKIGNPCKVNTEYHSGESYNVFLIGEEALIFFKGLINNWPT